jgi:DNA-binding MarR family transcriptional regulator
VVCHLPSDDQEQFLQLWQLLLKVSFGLRKHMRQVLGQWELTGPQWRVFRALGEAGGSGMMAGQISECLAFTHGNTTGIVDKLEEMGLAQRAPHPDDRRAILVQLTARGQQVYREVRPAFEQRVGELLACLSPAEAAQCTQLLDRLLQNLGATEARVEEAPGGSGAKPLLDR